MTINFEAKTDRELLVVTAQTCNDMNEHLNKLNGSILKHEQRLIKLETRSLIHDNPGNPSFKEKAIGSIGKSGVFAIIGTLIGGAIYALGNGIGWW